MVYLTVLGGDDRGLSAAVRGIGTPLDELVRLEDRRARAAGEVESRIMGAMLEACGELGYRSVSVQTVLDRAGASRSQFYARFADKADCYAKAYELEVERRYWALIASTEGERTWASALVRGLSEVARLLGTQTSLARALVIEVHVAGPPALEKRDEMVRRLARAMDENARREAEFLRSPSPPSETALFMLGAFEAFVTTALLRNAPHDFEAGLRELAHMALAAYLGDERADAELDILLAA